MPRPPGTAERTARSPSIGSATRQAILIFDEAGEVLFASPEVPRLIGRPIRRQADLEAALALAPDTAISDAEAVGGSPSLRPLDSAPSGSQAPLRLTVYALSLASGDGGRRRLVVARDVTLSRESGVLRDALADILAHELRTPVTSIYGGAQLILDPSISDVTRAEAARAVASEAERLYRTVEDLVILARFDEDLELADAPVLLQRFLPLVAGSEGARFPMVGVRSLVPDDLPPVRGRQGYIEQVVRHLLASAARFSPAGAPVTLQARQRRTDVEVRVIDDGAPISPEEAATMFDLYARNPRTAANSSGANLGLFVARRLVRAMGGEIRALTTKRPAIAFTLPIFPDDD